MMKKYLIILTVLFSSIEISASNSYYEEVLIYNYLKHTDTTRIDLTTFWTELQKAETLLIQTSIKYNKERNSKIFKNVTLERPLLLLLIRMASGLNIKNFTAEDYLVRYPFSNSDLITVQIEKLIALGFMEKNSVPSKYLISEKGVEVVSHWIQERGIIMELLDLGEITQTEINQVLEIDHRILGAISSDVTEENSPILYNRLSGLQPKYTPRKLWHHWQLVWTIIASHDDAIEYVRKSKGIDPLTWSIKREVWFVDRKPWLAESVTYEGLVEGSQNYAPQTDSEIKIKNSIDALKKVGWLIETDSKELHLTEEGLVTQDRDEELIMLRFFSKWPEISNQEMKTIYKILKKLNTHLEELTNSLKQ